MRSNFPGAVMRSVYTTAALTTLISQLLFDHFMFGSYSNIDQLPCTAVFTSKNNLKYLFILKIFVENTNNLLHRCGITSLLTLYTVQGI